MPARGRARSDAAAGEEVMHVGVIMELLRPGMQHREDADRAPDEAGIAGNIDDCMGQLHRLVHSAPMVPRPRRLCPIASRSYADAMVTWGTPLVVAGATMTRAPKATPSRRSPGRELPLRRSNRRPSTPPRAAGRPHEPKRNCSRAISGLVMNPMSSGTPALQQRASSFAHSFGKYRR